MAKKKEAKKPTKKKIEIKEVVKIYEYPSEGQYDIHYTKIPKNFEDSLKNRETFKKELLKEFNEFQGKEYDMIGLQNHDKSEKTLRIMGWMSDNKLEGFAE